MRKLLILFLLPVYSLGQSIVGQAVFTASQIEEMNTRLDNQTPYYFDANGIHGDGQEIYQGAENFLNDEESGNFAHGWYNVSSAVPLGVESNTGYNSEPRPGGAANLTAGTRNVDEDNFAAIISIIWKGRSDVVTFAGESGTKDYHSKRLANACRDYWLRLANDVDMDFSNTSKYPRTTNGRGTGFDNNPFFMIVAKVNKIINGYALTYTQMDGGSDFTTLENWFADAVDWAYDSTEEQIVSNIGAMPPYNNHTITGGYTNSSYGAYTYYNSSGGGGVNEISRLQASFLNNRRWDAISLIGNYGVHFNNTTYKNVEWEYFKFYLEVGMFPDGTSNEWYRASGSNGYLGFNYISTVSTDLVVAGDRHYKGVINGLTGMTDAGKFYNYSTAKGTDEAFSNYVVSSSTSGGSKSILSYLKSWMRYFLNPSDGGYIGVRHTNTGNQLNAYEMPFTTVAAMANNYYQDQELEDWANMESSAGFLNSNGINQQTLSDGTFVRNSGAFGDHGLGLTWGLLGSYGGSFGQRNNAFTGSAPSNLAAFPTAEGFGKYATGGRSGSVYIVNSLTGTGSGTLAEAITLSDRIIVFDVGGQITEPLNITGSNLTILGETAPTHIEISSTAESVISGDNIIIRNIAVRGAMTSANQDNLRITGSNIIIDHASLYHGTDGTIDIYGVGGNIDSITVQHSIIAKVLSTGSGSMLVTGDSDNLSFYNNYKALNRDRYFYSSDGGGEYEVINNVVYGFQENFNVSYEQKVDWINNVLKATATAPQRSDITQYFRLLAGNTSGAQAANGHYYLEGNSLVNNVENWTLKDTAFENNDAASKYFTNSLITPLSADASRILSDVGSNANTSLGNDSIDTALIANYNNTDGTFAGATPTDILNPATVTRLASYDSDNDGIGDYYELAVWGDLSKSHATDTDGDGYTDLEEFGFYLNGENGTIEVSNSVSGNNAVQTILFTTF